MLKISNETKVGVLATFAIVIVILGVNFLKGKNVFSRNIIFYALYDNVEGLSPSNPVILKGMQIGQVDNLKVDPNNKDKILVKFHIEGDITIPNNSTAIIMSPDLLGSKAIQIEPGNSSVLAKRYDTLQGKVQMSITENIANVVAPVKEKVEKLISSVDTVVMTLNDVFDENTKRNLRSSFHSIKKSLDNVQLATNKVNGIIGNESARLGDIMARINHIVMEIDKSTPNLERTIADFAAIGDSVRAAHLGQTLAKLNHTVSKINDILDKATNGEGSLGKFLNDNKLYDNLQSVSKDLDNLVNDLKANPSRYVNFSVIKIGGGNKKSTKKPPAKP